MNISTLKEALPYLIEAEVPAMLVGHHGVGKTEGVRQYCKDNGFMLKILNLGTQDVGDIIGLADFLKRFWSFVTLILTKKQFFF